MTNAASSSPPAVRADGSDLLDSYDVVCVGGAVIGSAVAYFLTEDPAFTGNVLVVEPDSTYEFAQSSRAQNCIREQFSNPMNIQICQFGLDFMANFEENVQVDGQAPALNFTGTGYLFLAKTDEEMKVLEEAHSTQIGQGADVRMLTPTQVAEEFPYMNVDGLLGARVGSLREGNFDGWGLMQGYRLRAVRNGATYLKDRVVGFEMGTDRVQRVLLESGRSVACGDVVNSAGPRARLIAQMAGLDVPVEPRARSSFVFSCRTEIPENVPLTVTPEGVHFRREQGHYMCGTAPENDVAVAYDDWAVRADEFEDLIWPVLASYVPAFDRLSVMTNWGGQYAYNTLDHNLIVGPSEQVTNLHFANGFSGHGLQQSAAVGRAVSELIIDGDYRTLDLSRLGYDRIIRNEPFLETAVI